MSEELDAGPVRRPTKPSRLGRSGAFAAGAVAATLVTASTVLAATGSFSDVPDTNPFFNDIEAVADACIAGGFADGTFKPGDVVSRQAMAAFLHRTASKTVQGTKVGGTNPTFGQAGGGLSSRVPVAQVVVTVPALPGSCQVPVEIHGQATVGVNGTLDTACFGGCQVRTVITKAGVAQDDSITITSVKDNGWYATQTSSWLTTQLDGTTVTYTLSAQGFNVYETKGTVASFRKIHAVIHPMQATPAP